MFVVPLTTGVEYLLSDAHRTLLGDNFSTTVSGHKGKVKPGVPESYLNMCELLLNREIASGRLLPGDQYERQVSPGSSSPEKEKE